MMTVYIKRNEASILPKVHAVRYFEGLRHPGVIRLGARVWLFSASAGMAAIEDGDWIVASTQTGDPLWNGRVVRDYLFRTYYQVD
jgi:nitrate reductase alpha subunit